MLVGKSPGSRFDREALSPDYPQCADDAELRDQLISIDRYVPIEMSNNRKIVNRR